MKNKTFVICIIVVVVLFSALFFMTGKSERKSDERVISEKEKAPKITEISTIVASPFEAEATIKLDKTVIKADFNKSTDTTVTLSVKEPKSLAGTVMEYDGKDITIGYKGLKLKLDENSQLASSAFSIILNSIKKAGSESGLDITTKDENLMISGESESGEFTLLIDKKNKTIASISLPHLDFECEFDNTVLLKE